MEKSPLTDPTHQPPARTFVITPPNRHTPLPKQEYEYDPADAIPSPVEKAAYPDEATPHKTAQGARTLTESTSAWPEDVNFAHVAFCLNPGKRVHGFFQRSPQKVPPTEPPFTKIASQSCSQGQGSLFPFFIGAAPQADPYPEPSFNALSSPTVFVFFFPPDCPLGPIPPLQTGVAFWLPNVFGISSCVIFP